jgi:type I restriction enzyme S subunit
MKSYLTYKPSGIDWIGQIPAHWEIAKVKNAFVRKKEKAKQENPTILSLTSKGIIIRDITNNEGQIAESYYEYNPVEVGDLLLNPMDLVTNAFSSISYLAGVISPAYINLRNKHGFCSRYFDYYFKLQYWNSSFFAHGKGVSFEHRWTLGFETLMNFPIPVPSKDEQFNIAKYLYSSTLIKRHA